jgi:deoxyadenosine/deoxycytidine kinase
MEKIFLPYIFERNINNKTILEIFNEENKDKKIVEDLIKAQSSIFEIKKILKNGFELYNLVNEKTYKVLSLTKMTIILVIYYLLELYL